MQKIIINVCYGGFSVSDAAIVEYARIKNITTYPEGGPDTIWGRLHWLTPATGNKQADDNRKLLSSRDFARDDPVLVEVVERLGAEANGKYAELQVVEIPDNVQWTIEEYDGYEHIAEAHRTWP